jgi:hypothetical protein
LPVEAFTPMIGRRVMEGPLAQRPAIGDRSPTPEPLRRGTPAYSG